MTVSKMDDEYAPTPPIKNLTYAGDYDGTVTYLAGLSEQQRYKLRTAVRRVLKLGWRLSGIQNAQLMQRLFYAELLTGQLVRWQPIRSELNVHGTVNLSKDNLTS